VLATVKVNNEKEAITANQKGLLTRRVSASTNTGPVMRTHALMISTGSKA